MPELGNTGGALRSQRATPVSAPKNLDVGRDCNLSQAEPIKRKFVARDYTRSHKTEGDSLKKTQNKTVR